MWFALLSFRKYPCGTLIVPSSEISLHLANSQQQDYFFHLSKVIIWVSFHIYYILHQLIPLVCCNCSIGPLFCNWHLFYPDMATSFSYLPFSLVCRSHSSSQWCSAPCVSLWSSCLCTQTRSTPGLGLPFLSLASLPTTSSFTLTTSLSGFREL